jgi:hypothetical protein
MFLAKIELLSVLEFAIKYFLFFLYNVFLFSRQPFVDSLSSCPKHGLHNPLKAPERSVFVFIFLFEPCS